MHTKPTHSEAAPKTRGRTIPSASLYDPIVWLLSFGRGGAIRRVTVELAQIQPGDRVLDVGCGTGDLTMAAKALVGASGRVVGTDASPEMIDLARRKATRTGVEVTFQVDLIEQMTFPDNQFDVVLSSLMMHHLPDDLKREGLAEIYRVLKPGGRLLILDVQSSSGGSVFRRLAEWMIHLHGGHTAMQDNVQRLVPLVEAADFTGVETGKLSRQLSFIATKKASAG